MRVLNTILLITFLAFGLVHAQLLSGSISTSGNSKNKIGANVSVNVKAPKVSHKATLTIKKTAKKPVAKKTVKITVKKSAKPVAKKSSVKAVKITIKKPETKKVRITLKKKSVAGPNLNGTCPGAKDFGFTEVPTYVYEGKACNYLKTTCCKKEELDTLQTSWSQNIEQMGQQVWSYGKLVGLLNGFVDNFDSTKTETLCKKNQEERELQSVEAPTRSKYMNCMIKECTDVTGEEHVKCRKSCELKFRSDKKKDETEKSVEKKTDDGKKEEKKDEKKEEQKEETPAKTIAELMQDTQCSVNYTALVEANKMILPYRDWYSKQLLKCYKTIESTRSVLTCAACDNTLSDSKTFEHKFKVKNIDSLINDCVSIFHFNKMMLKPAFSAASSLLKDSGTSVDAFESSLATHWRTNTDLCINEQSKKEESKTNRILQRMRKPKNKKTTKKVRVTIKKSAKKPKAKKTTKKVRVTIKKSAKKPVAKKTTKKVRITIKKSAKKPVAKKTTKKVKITIKRSAKKPLIKKTAKKVKVTIKRSAKRAVANKTAKITIGKNSATPKEYRKSNKTAKITIGKNSATPKEYRKSKKSKPSTRIVVLKKSSRPSTKVSLKVTLKAKASKVVISQKDYPIDIKTDSNCVNSLNSKFSKYVSSDAEFFGSVMKLMNEEFKNFGTEDALKKWNHFAVSSVFSWAQNEVLKKSVKVQVPKISSKKIKITVKSGEKKRKLQSVVPTPVGFSLQLDKNGIDLDNNIISGLDEVKDGSAKDQHYEFLSSKLVRIGFACMVAVFGFMF